MESCNDSLEPGDKIPDFDGCSGCSKYAACHMEDDCKHFSWDVDWYYCDLQEKEIDPNECRVCKNRVR